ncbi:PREDICTED: serine-rich single-pass membrane protein 1 [Chrysochloris asiatica]|uniref:Serine-rich single-pass membrane protein 1 n=1 Tax=Chrysochloris asiatica TaxID=185453 RepID=A0A9B0WNG0_CHRAS|nr:PREDICTED: serine-rich single-pass membrane protein 1 [Chrysochloris asiatica]
MGDLFSLFWEADPPSKPLILPIPNEDYECRKDDSCGTIGSFLLWYFVTILILMVFSRTSVWMVEKIKKDDDSGTSTSVSKASKDASYKQHSKDAIWDSLKRLKKANHIQLTPVTESEVALVSAYLERRRARRHSQRNQRDQIPPDSDSTECDTEESNSRPSSWKESASEHQPSPATIKRRKIPQRQKNLGSYQIRERPCLHCKAMRTNEWLTRHFFQNTSVINTNKGEIQEENSMLDINTEFSKF